MPQAVTVPMRNKLLQSLPPDDLFRIHSLLEEVPLVRKRVLHHARLPIEHVYFVEEGLVSVIAADDAEKQIAQAWLIGCEGMAGIPVVLGAESSPHKRVVQVEGRALRMRTADLRQCFVEVASFRDVLLRYVHAVMVQVSQSAACNSQHSIQQRLCRWLLMAQDRLGRDDVPITHEAIARLLGVRRASVTEKLPELESIGVVAAERRHIRILDRPKLEALSCGCYHIIASALRASANGGEPPASQPSGAAPLVPAQKLGLGHVD